MTNERRNTPEPYQEVVVVVVNAVVETALVALEQHGQIRITFTCPTYVVNAGPNQTLVACATTATLAGSAIPGGTTGSLDI